MKNPQADGELVLKALDLTSEAVFITDTGGRIVYANRAFGTMTGYSPEEALGKNASILKSGDNPQEFYTEMWATIKSGREWTGRFVNLRRDGGKYITETRITPVPGGDGRPAFYLAMRRDITKDLAMEKELAHARKMETLGLLAGQLSHDFNNILTIIIGSLDIVIEDIPAGKSSLPLAKGMLQAARDASALIKQLMIFARRQEYELKVLDLNAVIREVGILLDRALGDSVKTEFDLAPDLLPVSMEPEQFKQALLNLAVNARDAMPGGGTFRVSTRNAPRESGPARKVEIEVSDTGPGFSQETLSHLFEPFYTTKPKGKGTGLGLSTVYGVIKQHNGEIRADNRPGAGAVFTILLPAAPARN